MAVTGFIATVWSANIQQALRKAQVATQAGVVNRDYEGEIRQKGDTVKVGMIGDVTIRDFTKNADLAAPETLNDAQTMLTIDQAKYFNFQVDDVDAAQISPNLRQEATGRAGYNLKDAQDSYVLGLYAQATGAVGSSGSPKNDLATATKAYEYLVQLAVKLDEQNCPTDGRWAIVPPWFHAKLLLDDRFVKSGTDSAAAVLANGQVGTAAGFAILKSNNVSRTAATGDYRIMAGHPMAISFAEQITKLEAYRQERRFGDGVKGLSLYGAKVMRPDALATLFATYA